jgi:hypothetical protein
MKGVVQLNKGQFKREEPTAPSLSTAGVNTPKTTGIEHEANGSPHVPCPSFDKTPKLHRAECHGVSASPSVLCAFGTLAVVTSVLW